jgi:hypothetical protein
MRPVKENSRIAEKLIDFIYQCDPRQAGDITDEATNPDHPTDPIFHGRRGFAEFP